MCGIVGLVQEGAAGQRERLVAARELMWHRGPNDGGVWNGERACLGARRLSIVDLSAAGHQPMVSDDGRHVLVFNGEIYNFRDLRRELEREFRFRSHTDSEVILHGYRRWGLRELLGRLDGMFAFAIWDEETRTLVAARDRAGKKPLFYRHHGRSLQFASTLRVLLGLLPETPALDAHAVDDFLVYQAVPAPKSIFAGVSQLRPAHSLVFSFDTGACTIERYWDVSYAVKTRETEAEILEHVESLARDAVRKRLESDVTLGVFLSGGVDSSLVAALAARESARPIEAITLGFDEPEFDERAYARAAADRIGVRLHEETLRPALVSDLPSIIWHYGQPVADVSIVPSHYLSEAARRWMIVALNGDGGDELFGGYARPMIARAASTYRRALPPFARTSLSRVLGGLDRGPLRKLALLARAGGMSAAESFTYDRAFRTVRADAYADPFLAGLGDVHPDALYREAWDRADGVDDADRALYGDFTTYLPDQLLVKADRSSMAHSLEARSPLLDRALIEYAATIPTSIRLKRFRTKYVLKRLAERYVPRDQVYRRKRGFVMPASRWLRGELSPYSHAALDNPVFLDRGWVRPDFVRRMLAEHGDGRRDWGEQLWTLLVLEVWARLTLDRSLERDAPLEALLSRPERPRRPVIRTLQLGMEWFPDEPGGLNRLYFELVRHLPAAGVEVSGFVAGAANVALDSGGAVHGFAPRSAPLVRRLRAIRRVASPMLAHDPKLLVVSHFSLHAAPLLDLIGAHPLVVHFHGPWGLESGAEGEGSLPVRAKTAVERAVYRRAAAFIVLSRPFGQILQQRFGVRSESIHVIPGGVDVPRFAIRESRAECRARLGWPQDRPVVLAVRRLTRRMGLDDLVRAASRLRDRVPNVLVHIAGDGPMRGELQRLVASMELGEHVRVLGFVPDGELPAAYRAADLTVVPSVSLEGFGLSIAESLAAGTPCLVTPVGGMPEAVEGLSAALVLRAGGPDALADGLADALTGVTSLPDARACTGFARANYDWPVIVERVRRVYEEALR